MKLRDSRSLKQPELMIIPMIDIMFFLLVFFMLSTMYMVDLKTIPIKLPKAEFSAVDTQLRHLARSCRCSQFSGVCSPDFSGNTFVLFVNQV